MRAISFLLAIFIFSLAIIPCTDTMMPDTEHHETESLAHLDDNSHNHNHGDEEDECPPFCACQCCGIHVLAPNNSIPEIIEPKAVDTYVSHYSFDYSYQFMGGIWHPPTLS